MKYFLSIITICSLYTLSVYSQVKNTTHKVEQGETIAQIAQKYNVTPYDIYQLNPDVQRGLKPNSILLIPKKGGVQKAIVPTVIKAGTHKVEPKETLFSIEKKYGITDEALKKANPKLEKEGMKIGQILLIPSVSNSKIPVTKTEKAVYHDVLPKETKYSIAKLYGITVEELEKRNPEIIPNLTIGYQLLIKGTAAIKEEIKTIDSKKEIIKPIPVKTSKPIEYGTYEVKQKETLYSLSKMFGMSPEELTILNPDLSNGLKDGMLLKVPANTLIPQETKKIYTTLSKNTNPIGKKKIVLLLPFNLTKIEGDTINSTSMRLKKDKFLNMTLDFYAGALIAIDSAQTLGISADVKIYDSQETKNSSNVAVIIKENHLEDADAFIGPFYQSNIEKTAEIVSGNNIPVISPLSKDIGNPYTNLYQTIPTIETTKNAIFDYMTSKNGNVIAVIDKKKETSRQYIKTNHKEVLFANLLENGSLATESLKKLFVKDKMNYVILETANTGMIKSTMNTMLSVMALYKVQLVILSPNETLDTDEIDFGNLVKLKLMYPSITRENKSPEALVFENEFRKKNNIKPSTYATRGFDVTFDVITRLTQEKSFEETAETIATEQVDNKFEYYKKTDGGYTNKGVYILYYDSDLTIKEAN
jgi:LysM repeat protein/ABC-type branched-subunit amino acid transport system substrate-binding protein